MYKTEVTGINTMITILGISLELMNRKNWYLVAKHVCGANMWMKLIYYQGNTQTFNLMHFIYMITIHHLISRIWPRAAAVAERLWSAQSVTDKGDANKRMEEHACRLNRRGIEAQPPTGPGFCLV